MQIDPLYTDELNIVFSCNLAMDSTGPTLGQVQVSQLLHRITKTVKCFCFNLHVTPDWPTCFRLQAVPCRSGVFGLGAPVCLRGSSATV